MFYLHSQSITLSNFTIITLSIHNHPFTFVFTAIHLSLHYNSLTKPHLPLTWWEFTLEHVHGNNVDDHDPNRTIEKFGFVLDKGNDAHTLCLQLRPVGVLSSHLPLHILLEFVDVEQLYVDSEERVLLQDMLTFHL